MEGKSNWYGKEVEGRLYGLKTKFIRYEIGELPKDIPHLYFTKEFLSTDENIRKIDQLATTTSYVISVECNREIYPRLLPNIKVRCHLIYRIVDDFPFELKMTDSIFIDKEGMYNVLCFTKHNALTITPNDYSNDVL